MIIFSGDRDLVFLHRLQERGLGLGRRPVDLVAQDDMGEDRPLDELHAPVAGAFFFLEHLGAGNIRGHEVGGELDAAEVEREQLGDAGNHQRLGQARDPLQNAMPLAEERDQDLLEHVALTDDHPPELARHLAVDVGQHLRRAQVRRIGLTMVFDADWPAVAPRQKGIVPVLHHGCSSMVWEVETR